VTTETTSESSGTSDSPRGDRPRPGEHARAILDLLPPGAYLDADGSPIVAGCRVLDVAAEFGTPTLLIDSEALRQQARRFRDGLAERWPDSQVLFATKAFPATAVERVFAAEGLGCDVVGRGELAIALGAGFDPDSIFLQGNAKDDADIRAAADAGVGTVVVDCFDDIDRLEHLGRAGQRVLIRVNPDIRADTNEKMATGHAGSKFGLPPDQTREAIRRIESSDRLHLDGLHVHVGSQIFDTEPFGRAVEILAALGEFEVYDVGGGLGVPYTTEEKAATVEEYLDTIVDVAHALVPAGARLIIEPGRALVARAGLTVYTVVTVKRAGRVFVAVDGGMGDNLDPALYGQRYSPFIANRIGGGEVVDLVGRHCETGDVIVPQTLLNDPSVGDLVVMPATGAYAYTMSNNYNGAPRIPVVFLADGKARVVIRRETIDELTRRDVE
jgi:diaminopimelate decarboxylase